MSGSVVFYRFKAQKEPSTVQFEGTGISVWDLKKEILAENKLGKGADFDFAIYNADTNEEYSDDKSIVPRSTSVIARRLPPSRPGKGNAQNYMASTLSAPSASGPGGMNAGRRGNMSQRFDFRDEPTTKAATPTPQPIIEATASTDANEASKIAAMFASTDEQWKTTQEKMSTATYYGFRRPGGSGAPGGSRPPQHAAPDKPVPPGYVCYRCGQSGHWIQECPTNSDPDYRNKPRIKRTTGIPKSFLQTVEAPTQDGENQAGLMVTAEGNFVIAKPDAASWEKHRAVTANLTSSDIQNAPPTDPDLTCPLCSRLLRDAVKTPCCSTSYCEECIHNYLSENDFVCPECESKIKSLKNLGKDEDRRERAKKYLEDTLKASKAAGEAEKAEKERSEGRNGHDTPGTSSVATEKESSPNTSKAPVIKTEDLGPAEEGELAGDEEAVTNTHSQSPGSNRAVSVARSDAGSQNGRMTSAKGTLNDTLSGKQNGTGGVNNGSNDAGMANNMMSQGQMNNMFDQFNSNFGRGQNMPPQMQMLQNQMQGTMQMLQNPNLPPQTRMQLSMQLQQIQYTFGQMMNQMNNGYGNPMQMQMAMYAQAQQLAMLQQQQQYAMMQGGYGFMGGQYGNYQNNNSGGFQRTGQMNYSRHASQYAEDSADSPYMRVPTNPKFKGGKRDRPDDFLQVDPRSYKR